MPSKRGRVLPLFLVLCYSPRAYVCVVVSEVWDETVRGGAETLLVPRESITRQGPEGPAPEGTQLLKEPEGPVTQEAGESPREAKRLGARGVQLLKKLEVPEGPAPEGGTN